MTITQFLNRASLEVYGKHFYSLNIFAKFKVIKSVLKKEATDAQVFKEEDEKLKYEGNNMLHTWFGLSYNSFIVMPRCLLQEMPYEWQGKLTKLMEEWDDTWDFSGQDYDEVVVRFRDAKGKMVKTPEWFHKYKYPLKGEIYKLKSKLL